MLDMERLLSALHRLLIPLKIQQITLPNTSAEFLTENFKGKRKVEAGENLSVVRHTIYLTITAITSRGGPEEMAVMTDKASSWARLQKVWANSLFYGLRCYAPMGTFYQRNHSSQQDLCTIWLGAGKHQGHLMNIYTLISNPALLDLSCV